jgi:hypothetical protein
MSEETELYKLFLRFEQAHAKAWQEELRPSV